MVKHVWKPLGGRTIPDGAHESTWTAADGTAIRRLDWRCTPDASRGSILFLPGRGDFYEKYLETFDYWGTKGWHVTAADWRGQAGSAGPPPGPVSGDIADFAVWIDDLADLYQAWRAQAPAPHVVIGHSMGGHLVLRALAQGRIDPVATVLSAPMLGFATILPRWLQRIYAAAMVRTGDPARPAWKTSEKPGARAALRANLLTHDAGRYADEQWWRAQRPWLSLVPASWRWLQKSSASFDLLDSPGMLEAVKTPVLLVATRHDRLVSWRAIARAARRLPRAQLVAWGREGRHELLRESDPVRDRVLATIDEFLEREAPANAAG